jgi:2-succinyl-6-hydroxy-2,4-cyclohexadiene-1-carboxylate synthase
MKVYALHGLLGSPADWSCFAPEKWGAEEVIAVDLFHYLNPLFPSERPLLDQWARTFIASVKQKSALTERRILLGYSLGGRLALHVLLLDPTLWDGAVLVSTHPGLSSLEEKEKRRQVDEQWADWFLHKPWEEVLQLWNQQEVLKNSAPLAIPESQKTRMSISAALQTLSLAFQDDLRSAISQLEVPLLWVCGEKDTAYVSMSSTLTFAHSLSAVQVAANSGHRVPWDNPKVFQENMSRYVEALSVSNRVSTV